MQTVCRIGTGFSSRGWSANRRNTRHNATEGRSGHNRWALLFTSAPLAALAAFAVFCGIVQTQVRARDSAVRWGQLTADDARTMAQQELTQLLGTTGGNVTVENATAQESVLFRREGQTQPIATHSWYVTLNSDTARYLVRLNADTRQIYAVNRFDIKNKGGLNANINTDVPGTPVSQEAQSKNLLSKLEGEILVRRCLRQLDIPENRLTALPARAVHSYGNDDTATSLWEFSYSCPTPGWGTRKLRICIDRRTGNLENIWNPSAVLTVL